MQKGLFCYENTVSFEEFSRFWKTTLLNAGEKKGLRSLTVSPLRLATCCRCAYSAGVFSLKYSCESALSTALDGSLMARLAAPDWP